MNPYNVRCDKCWLTINTQTDAHRKETSVDKKVRYWHLPVCTNDAREEPLRDAERAARRTH